jgi:hypothetical protein
MDQGAAAAPSRTPGQGAIANDKVELHANQKRGRARTQRK